MNKERAIMKQIHLSIQQLQQGNFIPTAVRKKGNTYQLEWQDVGEYGFTVTESKFEFSLQNLNKEQPLPKIETNLDLLLQEELLENTLYPNGFIFHITRCGSTAFAKALAQVPSTIVYDEPLPLYSGAFQYFTDDWTDYAIEDATKMQVLKNLILAMGKKRNRTASKYFIKFRSWNCIFVEYIKALFPDVPCLFIYRNPAEVLVSRQKRLSVFDQQPISSKSAYIMGYPLEDIYKMSQLEFQTQSIRHLFASVWPFHQLGLPFLNYQDFKKENFEFILQKAFHYYPSYEELKLMLGQFERYSKDQKNKTQYEDDTQEKLRAVTPDLQKAADSLNDIIRAFDRKAIQPVAQQLALNL